MKKYIKIPLTLFCIVLIGTGCKKFLDVNTDPNHTLKVSESLLLGPIEKTMAGNTIVGEVGAASTYWTQQVSINQPTPTLETYEVFPEDVNNTWTFGLYPGIFENLKIMINQAEAAHHNQYIAIGKTLFAYNLAVATDFWNDIPYSQALNTSISKPKYDSQQAIYHAVQMLLDSAIYYVNQTPSPIAPSNDDFIYGGDMGKWKKFMYTLKARYYMRLTKAPGHTAAAQADSALTALQNGFSSNGDNASIAYNGSANDQNPWFGGTEPGAGGVVLAKFFVDGLNNTADPRLPVIANKSVDGKYVGRPSGADPAPDYTVYATIGTYFGGVDPVNTDNVTGAAAPLIVATYSEALFLQAEATFIKSGAAAAASVYKAAIAANMSQLGVSTSDQATFLTSLPVLTAANGEAQIIGQKYVTDFLSVEAYNDWRRTGYPVLSLVQNAYVQYIPRRFPYSSTELLANPQPQQSATTADRVWWDVQ
ncbi:SusD/RagB family nutrient-binding outer membrane lipoprotein [Mucilaginibacter sp. OK098]|uniref:SusD/RagB family nutrient-binding outer membrane lipoprotein n=1 Tax=Mucilaginibacter sp. OK098 TaxID=1855297 RepID=UPI00091B3B22|nr:SusD/RagB family nutrient-binding outer membrane lipoprotein [Mucilaginibacter sp. OK098]SHN35830.1 Starch-binding associating with outer membrane [Mucilaginibacter sp. OK098]